MNAKLTDILKQLRLSGLAESLSVRLQEAAANRLSHAEFLELILEDELAVRRDRAIERNLRAACFREQKTLEDFDWDFNRTIKRKRFFDLASGEFLRKHRDALLIGPPGVGKPQPTQYSLCHSGMRRPGRCHRPHSPIIRPGIPAVWSGSPAGTRAALPG